MAAQEYDFRDFLTLHFEVANGEHVNLSTVGRSLIEFERMAREVAARSDPFINFELRFERSEEGSLRLITSLRERVGEARLRTLAWTIITALLLQPIVGIVSEDAWRGIMEGMGYPPETMSDEEILRISRTVVDALKDEEVQRARNNLYQALEADPSVEGIGAKPGSSPGKPFIVVPKGLFASMALSDAQGPLVDPLPRVVTSEVTLVLIRPVLQKASKAAWEFRHEGKKLSAKILDENFIAEALSGGLSIPLIEGVELTVVLEDHQFFEGGVWHHQDYSVRKVVEWHLGAEQPSLPYSDGCENEDDDDEGNQK